MGKVVGMEALRSFLNSQDLSEQGRFAKRCGTTLGYIRKVLSLRGRKRFGETLAIAFERESGGRVPVEDTRSDVDWAYLKSCSSRSLSTTKRKRA